MSYWQEVASKVIGPILEAGQEAGKPPKVILAEIDAAYPFGLRDLHPYKMWLKVRREAMKKLGLVEVTVREQPAFSAGPLFGEERQ